MKNIKTTRKMKKYLIPLILLCLLLAGGLVWLYLNLDKQKQENKEMQELAALDKQEMENEYQQFALQYSEMKTQINNDSIVAQLSAEQEKTQRLLALVCHRDRLAEPPEPEPAGGEHSCKGSVPGGYAAD